MIYYFTGNGNSCWVAEQIALATNDKTRNMSDYIREGTIPNDIDDDSRLGIVFPVHSWYAPRPVVDFLVRLRLSKSIYRYIVCTCGDDVGECVRRLSRHYVFDAAWSVVMPETYIPMFNLDTDENASYKIKDARRCIAQIAFGILNRQKVIQVEKGSYSWLKTYLINPIFVHCIIGSRKFHIKGKCTECGTCVKVCPMNNIMLFDGGPVWGNNCIHCMGCIHVCPAVVIEYGKSTRKRGRYHLQRYLK